VIRLNFTYLFLHHFKWFTFWVLGDGKRYEGKRDAWTGLESGQDERHA
jgi:hypothetical protein